MSRKPFVVVSGLPASGKSTLARKIATVLDVPCIDKDDLLERLFLTNAVSDPTQRRSLSRLADLELMESARRSRASVLVSWWRHPRSNADSGTPIKWLGELHGPVVEVHCFCTPEVAVERFLARERHPGHLDSRWSREQLLEMFHNQAAYGPIYPDSAICIPTDHLTDVGPMTDE
ncbi:AAA family ATPase [Paraburkholderia terricola]|uniref:AAA family ATPase n=1 Tax=Paraburkholderia terricola TaxID=169427 RepID=UPI0035B5159A